MIFRARSGLRINALLQGDIGCGKSIVAFVMMAVMADSGRQSSIEVGVNLPTATAIVIHNAERFGLSQLHQLRGRVGRSQLQSYCVLESDTQTEAGKMGLEAMCSTTDGFAIAEADLKIRGASDFIGTKQSGDNKYMSLMLAFPETYEIAKKTAEVILDRGDDCCVLADRVAAEQRPTIGGTHL